MGKNCVDLDSSPPTRGGVSSRQDYEVVISNFFHDNIKCRTKIPLITENGITESYNDAMNRFWENKYSIEIEKNRVMIKEKK